MKSFVLIAVLAAFAAASPVVPAQICTKICLFEEPDCPGGVAVKSGGIEYAFDPDLGLVLAQADC
ncbi:uncharacterized protein J4E79_003629 [Alternaria viburni]|uniref:uncharacterized protein n=1 Tax=Alternaria viburni TaxID=566460 RepID=UPI0020C2C574|nr:uncharacterized protein J4E79_003629 [Alternaria viburni]KAI4664128.1 hypothetical protein J4E79_003629 [Alternaria viburni]